nr:EOG090X0CBY [Eubosmina coregoni]
MAASIVQNVLDKAFEEEADKIKSIQVDKPVDLEYDLGNLLAYDINDFDINELRSDKEAFLAKISRDNVQLLINQIFQLPTAKVDNEIVIKLPPGTTRLPRAKPVPKAKELTKWEKYAKEKGITKRKKANTEWDEELNRWVPRFGFQKNVAEKEKNWVVELPGNAKDTDDPIEQKKAKKKEAVAKNELQRLRNLSARMMNTHRYSFIYQSFSDRFMLSFVLARSSLISANRTHDFGWKIKSLSSIYQMLLPRHGEKIIKSGMLTKVRQLGFVKKILLEIPSLFRAVRSSICFNLTVTHQPGILCVQLKVMKVKSGRESYFPVTHSPGMLKCHGDDGS